MNERDEEALILQSQQGNTTAFEQLARRYEGPLYNLAYRMTGDASVAQDILQETLTSAYRQIKRFQPGNFRAWLFRIAANASKDFLRSADHRRQVSLEHLSEAGFQQWTDPGESPEQYTLRQEVSRVIQQAMLHLPPDQRALLILIDLQGLDYQAAAEALRVPIGTVKSRLSRARATMRQHLSAHAELLPSQFRFTTKRGS